VNKHIICGHVGKDIELRYTQSGTSVANFSVATNEHYKDKDGESKEIVSWHNCVAYGQQAELLSKFATKGRQVLITGSPRTRTYIKEGDRPDDKRYITEVRVNEVELLGPSKGEQPPAQNGNDSAEDGAHSEQPF